MTAVAILPESEGADGTTYRAIARYAQSVGKTAGEALDALTAQLGEEEAGTLIIVQLQRPDRFFSEQQQERYPYEIELQSINELPPPSDLPTTDEIVGSIPDVTNGMDVVSYLRELRDEEEAA